MTAKKCRNDIILIASLIAVCSVIILYMYLTRSDGNSVTVTVDGKPVASYSLSENRTVTIGSGEHTNILVIKDGYAQISDASCPDKLCVHEKKIKYNGQSIVCLPNKTVITVVSSDESSVDFIS